VNFVLNISVLTKMPRDCTALAKVVPPECTVPLWWGYPIHTMQPKKKNGKNSNRGRGGTTTRGRGTGGRGRSGPPRARLQDNRFLLSVVDPFNEPSAHIPDDRSTDSGLVTSKLSFTSAFSAVGGTSTSHSFGFILPPYPYYACLIESSAGNGTLTDVSSVSGVWYNQSSTSTNPLSVPNLTAILGDPNTPARVRCVGIGLRVIYEGSEMNRSGKYVAGLCPADYLAKPTSGTVNALSCLSTLAGSTTASVATVRGLMTRVKEERIGDVPFECRWVPAGVPAYQVTAATWTGGAAAAGVVSTSTGSPVSSLWCQEMGGPGAEIGQNALVFLVEGDNTSSALVSSNVYSFELIWHWEVIPSSKPTVSYDLTPSPADPMRLAQAINVMSQVSVTRPKAKGNFR